MKFLLDVGITPELGHLLEAEDHDFRYVPHFYSNRLKDVEIMDIALEHGEVVVTHDLDFGTLLAFSQKPGPSVILFRLHQVSARVFYQRLTEHWNAIESHLATGAPVIVEPAGIRIRLLPI